MIPLLAVLMMSTVAIAPVFAPATWPNLPSTHVHLTVVYGSSSYFVATLSGVPAGYDVHNQNYPCWCVDRSVTMTRSVSHSVYLYSSLSGALPAPISSIHWDAINYILNHKQGSMTQIQEAIWHFTNNFSPSASHTAAWAMINAAEANEGYVPGPGGILAVICYNQAGAAHVQNTIIELRVPTQGEGLSPGYWKHNVAVYCGTSRGSFSGDPHITAAQLDAYEAWIRANIPGQSGFTLEWANSRFQNVAYKSQWLTIANWFNAAAGLQPYSG